MSDKEFTQICKEILALDTQIRSLSSQVSTDKSEVSEKTVQTLSAKERVEELNGAISLIKTDLDGKKADFDSKYGQIASLLARLNELKGQIEAVLRSTPITDQSVSDKTAYSSQKVEQIKTTIQNNIQALTQSVNSSFLAIRAKAADSDKLDGLDSLAFSRGDHNHDDIYVKQNNTLPTGDVTAKAFWENVPAGVYVAWGEGYTNKPGAGSNDWVMVLGSHQRSRLNKMVVWFNSSDFTVWQGVVSSSPTVNFVPFNYEALESSKLPNGNTKTSNYWAGVKPGLYYAGASDAGVTNSPSASGVYHVTTCGNAPTQKVILFLSSADDAKAYKIAFNGAGQTKEWVEVSTPQGTKQANGYVILQNGLIVQWMSSETKSGTFNFPIAFPNQCFQIVASLSVVSSNNLPNQHIGATVVNNSQFKITQGADLVSPWRMIAVGH